MEKRLKQLLEMLQTLEEGIDLIGREGDPAMMRECITAIRAIREVCQQSMPLKRQAVYVELFDGMAEALQQLSDHADRESLKQTADLCRELLDYARMAMQKELTRKKIMVFLPYKASMWDSLESVWKAAYEDKEHCETYVIPIPYCDRNPDMTAKEWHCEANLFPDYVPVLDWREYSRDKLREMHPDVIFIHNPYDNFNAVTSVDMQYYSRNLKGCADKLVYIPYFVVGDTISPHFCQTQGVVNADYVIVQDENIKEQYERYYPDGNPPKGKFLALGSPKFDKVCNAVREDYVLPEKWQRLIGDKKVILYNTSLTAMLEHSDKFTAKLRYVFDIFKQRDDVVLWWRPHPLLRATIASMTPAIRDEYHQIEQQYIDEDWGIYDDTPDMDRAIVCTDAYYGDMSSLVWLYQKTGKPVMIESFTGEYSFEIRNNIYENGYTYAITYGGFILIVDWAQHNIAIKELLSTDVNTMNQCFSGIAKINSTLIVAPFRGNTFIEYDIEEDRQYSIECKAVDKELANMELKVNFCTQCCNRIFFYTGYNKPRLIELKVKGHHYEIITDFTLVIEREIGNGPYQFSKACVKNNSIYWVIYGKNYVIEFNLALNKTMVHSVGMKNQKYSSIDTDGQNIWLISLNESKIICWDTKSDYITEIQYPCDHSGNILYGQILCGKNKIYLYYWLNLEKRNLLLYDLEKRIFQNIEGELSAAPWIDRVSAKKILFLAKDKEKYYLKMISLDVMNSEKVSLGLSDKEFFSLAKNNLDKKIIYETRDLYTLSNFMKYCLNSQYNVKQRLVEKECGKIVCQFI